MKVKLRINRVAGGHRQRRGKVYDVPTADALSLVKSGRAEAVAEAVIPRKARSKKGSEE